MHKVDIDMVDRHSLLPRDGFTSINTLRSACASPTRVPAPISVGRMSAYFHRKGVHLGLGSGGLSRLI